MWLIAAAVITWMALPSLRTDFYSSIPRDRVAALQQSTGVKVVAGSGWIHAGWIADPERESYRVLLRNAGGGDADAGHDAGDDAGDDAGGWRLAATTRYGSALLGDLAHGHDYEVKVEAIADAGGAARQLAVVRARTAAEAGPLERPVIAGPWRHLFRPSAAGDYINDHAVYRDAGGRWRLLGITGPGPGDYSAETRLAQGVAPGRAARVAQDPAAATEARVAQDPAATTEARVAQDAPGSAASPASAPLTFAEVLAAGGMTEDEPVADYRQPAWAPHVVRDRAGLFHLFWSPHRLAHAVSVDGTRWYRRADAIARPDGWFFRDAMVLEVAEGQWLLYATSRGWWYSRVDLYQSFDLDHWQRIGAAWQTGWGSERNALVSSAESPFVVVRDSRYYLSITYNNESGVMAPILLALGHWSGGAGSYNDTLVFGSGNPYDFGQWRGRRRPSNLVAALDAHAPEFVHDDHHGGDGAWYVTTAGWPLAATLTSGEVAAAPLRWELVAR